MRISSPKTLPDACRMLAESDRAVTPIAGGTDLLVSWHHRPKNDLSLLDLSCLESDLRPIRWEKSFLELGALTTYWDVIRSPEVSREFPLLAQAARQVGAIQIQTRGTWAGNIGNGSPAADGVPVMMAYGARVVLKSVTGEREIGLDSYWTGYKQSVKQADELIVAIRLPRRPRSFEWFHKVGARTAQAITKVGVAMVKDDDCWRVVANSVAPYIARCNHLEQALAAGGRFASPIDVRQAAEKDMSPIDDIRSTAAYRLNVLSRLIFYRLTVGP